MRVFQSKSVSLWEWVSWVVFGVWRRKVFEGESVWVTDLDVRLSDFESFKESDFESDEWVWKFEIDFERAEWVWKLESKRECLIKSVSLCLNFENVFEFVWQCLSEAFESSCIFGLECVDFESYQLYSHMSKFGRHGKFFHVRVWQTPKIKF